MMEVIGKNRMCQKLSETEIDDENILGHFQEVIQRVEGSEELRSAIGVEYACLRSMMLEPKKKHLNSSGY